MMRMPRVAVTLSDRQFQQATFETGMGPSAHALLMHALRHEAGPPGQPESRLRTRLTSDQVDAVRVMFDRGASFSPSFTISDPGSPPWGSEAWREHVLDARAGSLHDILVAAYPSGYPEEWARVLEDPHRWLLHLSGAYMAIYEDVERLWRRARRSLAVEQLRFEVSRESATAARAFVADRGPLQVSGTSISLPWFEDITQVASGRLIWSPLITSPRFPLVLLHDEADVRDVDVTVSYGLRAPDPEQYRGRPSETRLDIVLGGARAMILREVGSPTSMSDLSSQLNYAPATMTYHVKKLEDAGLVLVERDGGFARVSRSVRAELLIDLLS